MRRFVCAALLASGCASYATEPAEPVPPVGELARICVVRSSPVVFASPMSVHDNGRLVGVTEPRSYFCYWAAPGGHVIKSHLGDDIDRVLATGDIARETIAADAGETHYLLQQVDASGPHQLVWLNEARANEIIGDCKPLRVVDAPRDERVPLPGDVAPPVVASRSPGFP